MSRRTSSLLIIVGLAVLILAVDRWTKMVVWHNMHPGDVVSVISGYFDITHVQNTGAAMGFLVGQNLLLTILSVVAIILLIAFRHSFATAGHEHLLALGLIMGGILGNLVDRIQFKYVIDFLYLHWQDRFHWYVFNIADASICVGVGSYILALMVKKKKPEDGGGKPELQPKPDRQNGQGQGA